MTRSVELIAFDGDDTLWHSENEFVVTQERVRGLLAPHCEPDDLDRLLLETERRNLELYGYGAKSFTLSVIETAIELAGEDLTTADVREILHAGKELLAHPVRLLDGAAEALEWTAERWPVALVTKGDLFHQESKVARSGLGELFAGVHVVAEKDEATYLRVFQHHGVDPAAAVMVGNSPKSDAAPVLALGGWAVHVPYHLLFELERLDDDFVLDASKRFRRIKTLAELPAVLEQVSPAHH